MAEDEMEGMEECDGCGRVYEEDRLYVADGEYRALCENCVGTDDE